MPTPYAAVQDLFNGDGYIYITDSNGSLTPGTFQSLTLLQSGAAPGFNLDLEGYPNDIRNKGILARILNQNSLSPYTARPYRIFLDPDPGASSTSLAGAAEVTDLLSLHGLESPPSSDSVVVAANTITSTRISSLQYIHIDGDTTAGAANQVTSIVYEGAQADDLICLTGIDGAVSPEIMRVTGIEITAASYTLVGNATSIWLRVGPGGVFQQAYQWPAAADLRAEDIPLPLTPGVYALTPPNGGTMVLHPNVAGATVLPDIFEHDVVLVGVGVVLAANLNFLISGTAATGLVEGDCGYIFGNSVPITTGVNFVNFSDATGTLATLTPELALSGKWTAKWEYVGVISGIDRCIWTILPNFSSTNTQFIIGGWIKDGDIGDAKIAPGINGSKLTALSVPQSALSAIVQAKLDVQGRNRVTIPIVSASVLTLNTTPVLAVPAPGAGFAILVEQVTARIAYAAPVYATNVNLQLIFTGAGEAVAESSSFLVKSVNGLVNIPLMYTVGAAVTQLLENTDLYIRVETGDPSAGASDIFLYIDYSILAL